MIDIRENFDRIVGSLYEEYKDEIDPSSMILCPFSLPELSARYRISIDERLAMYYLLAPGVGTDAFAHAFYAEVGCESFEGEYLQLTDGIIVPKELQSLIKTGYALFNKPKSVFLVVRQ